MVLGLGAAAMGPWLDRYDAVLTAVVEEHQGKVLEFVGDSAVAVFARPGDGVAAAVRLNEALEAAEWPTDPPRLQTGIHTGEAQRWESSTRAGYVGAAVLRAVCGAAGLGQVAVSPATEALLDPSSTPGIAVRPIGERELRQFGRPCSCTRPSPRSRSQAERLCGGETGDARQRVAGASAVNRRFRPRIRGSRGAPS